MKFKMTLDLLHKKVHFIGIGGISMSGLAHILLDHGIMVSGSDRSNSDIIENLKKSGAKIYIGHNAENVEGADLVVFTAAISKDNSELVRAKELGIKTMERSDFLGELMLDYEMPVSVSGTHGKTTTTSMLSCVMLDADKDPTVLVGGQLSNIGGNYRIGSKNSMIFEGCEYVDSFLKFNPKAAVILNVDADHLDYFSGIEQIKQSFNKFLRKIPKDGFAVINADDKNTMDCLSGVECELITYGNLGDYSAKNINFSDTGCADFDVYYKDELRTHLQLNVKGMHNVSNALAVFACAERLGVDIKFIKSGIESFHGTKRRFEKKGVINGASVYDDYAHHPTEITATLKSAKSIKHNKVICIFQPHTYSRTKALLDDFANALSIADEVIVTDIYAARETVTLGVSGKTLADKISGAKYISLFEDIASYIKETAKTDDIVITMGAGTITKLSDLLTQ